MSAQSIPSSINYAAVNNEIKNIIQSTTDTIKISGLTIDITSLKPSSWEMTDILKTVLINYLINSTTAINVDQIIKKIQPQQQAQQDDPVSLLSKLLDEIKKLLESIDIANPESKKNTNNEFILWEIKYVMKKKITKFYMHFVNEAMTSVVIAKITELQQSLKTAAAAAQENPEMKKQIINAVKKAAINTFGNSIPEKNTTINKLFNDQKQATAAPNFNEAFNEIKTHVMKYNQMVTDILSLTKEDFYS